MSALTPSSDPASNSEPTNPNLTHESKPESESDAEWEEEVEVGTVQEGNHHDGQQAVDTLMAPGTTITHNSEAATEPRFEAPPVDFHYTPSVDFQYAPTTSSSSFSSASSSSGASSLHRHLRRLLRPYGPLTFDLMTTIEPSVVPIPPKSLYPSTGPSNNQEKAGNKRSAPSDDPEESSQSPEEYYAILRQFKSLSLIRVGQNGRTEREYDAHRHQPMIRLHPTTDEMTLGRFIDLVARRHISVVDRFFRGAEFELGTSGWQRLFRQHEYFDPYRLLTRPPRSNEDMKNVRFPLDRSYTDDRMTMYSPQLEAAQAIPLELSSTAAFTSSHVTLTMCELDSLHAFATTPFQRSREGVAHHLKQPPPPKELFTTFIDLSGGEGAASEWLLWRRRTVNLRARGWGYDLNATVERANWHLQWKNVVAKDQAKNFDVFHPPHQRDGNTSNIDLLHQLIAEKNIDTFQRMIDQQTRGVGVQLAFACAYRPMSMYHTYNQASHCWTMKPEAYAPILLFQIDLTLRTLALGGTFVLQLQETTSPFALSLLSILFELFDSCILHQLVGQFGYGSGQSILLCRGFHHDRLKVRPSAFTVVLELKGVKAELEQMRDIKDWSQVALASLDHIRDDHPFAAWIKKYNQM